MHTKSQYLIGLMLLSAVFSAVAASKQSIKIAYLFQERAVPAALSNLDAFIQNKGQLGAELAISDNNTTGQFTQQQYELKTVVVPVGGDMAAAFNALGDDIGLVVLNVTPAQVNQLADLPSAQNKLLFDAASSDDELRGVQCRRHVLHILPSRAMRADALAQYMLKKRWREWFLVVGQTAEDRLYAAAIKRAAKRYGMKLVAEKAWDNTYDARRTAQADVPQFTQGEDYDVLVVADEQGLFGEYLDYRTWLPRPVIGTQGLIATAWHRTHEQWGAVQLQNRFKESAGRWMEEEDYAAYLAVRAIGEASVRAKSNQASAIKDYMLSEAFALQGYKGKPMSFRAWDGQLRQPILLAAPRSLVGVAPVEGFLHPTSELDTLGYDQPETACK
ncbi:ABC transporter substrate-binding protein [Methylomonas sp. SURF-2]|uniref:ABC transporter substrate-binding protein n=1 Tax=Methylomonas subterranea TaxID=2952225 RepID=A0ABT1TG57_9GAMM|nr:ABC transporter substrate-binding protein [Methylomonas sp. SURF-2]MCQ8103744.1 ABC transporter substrate-binding protein [Methylomonas sp. SURF-2]